MANVSPTFTPTRFGKSFGARLRGLKSFGRNEDGSLIVFSLFIFLVMLMVGGIAVDVIYLETQRTRMQYTLDRAILAAASLDQSLDPEFVVRDYFEKSGLTGFDIQIEHKTIESAGLRNYRWVKASTSLEIDTSFMRLAGVDHLSSPAFGSAEEGITDVEISLVVDVSGSMRYTSESGNSKLYELQKAAKEFGYAMLCNPSDPNREQECTVEDGRVSLSIVPYAAQVDVGADLSEQYGVFSDHTFSRCVDFSSDDFKSTSISMSGDLLQSAHFDYWNNSSRSPSYFYCDTTGSGRDIQPMLSDYSDVDTFINSLYADKSTSIDQGMKWGVGLLDPVAQPAIQAITEKDNPNIDPVYSERPLPFGDGINVRDSSKVIVLMTDGKHEGRPLMNLLKRRGATPVYQELVSGEDNLFIYYEERDEFKELSTGDWVSSPGTYEVTGEEEECTWYQNRRGRWYQRCVMVPTYSYVEVDMDDENSIKQVTWPELFAMKTESWIKQYSPLYDSQTSRLNTGITPTMQDANLFESCDAAKKKKILIFTIGFEVENAYLDVMRDCASTENHFFDVDGTNISAAFAAIASQINRLRLTQ
ncbi:MULTISPECIES: TadE/TadG family type IV pilus assembly protein [Falsihalocynthiibacter]|uniref:TadE/TadG family type IV pilus assembly protein n=1 Tax=Falsihalocynthiibacter TaxID=2854182 RepID=UPI0030018872